MIIYVQWAPHQEQSTLGLSRRLRGEHHEGYGGRHQRLDPAQDEEEQSMQRDSSRFPPQTATTLGSKADFARDYRRDTAGQAGSGGTEKENGSCGRGLI